MTTISATIIADSVNNAGDRLTTVQCVYPRWIHAEVMTHRQFSRNASSSRAIPVKRMIEDIRKDPAMPLFWGRNKRGMQAGDDWTEKLWIDSEDGSYTEHREEAWLMACRYACKMADAFADADYHKQVVNRLLEPFMHIRVLISATEWSNFFALRIHDDAEPHIRVLAERIKEAMDASTPNLIGEYGIHTPYVRVTDNAWSLSVDDLCRVSAARCARVSYIGFDGEPTRIEQDLALADKLFGSSPIHASPAEHVAFAHPDANPQMCGNFHGWTQYRKMLSGECL